MGRSDVAENGVVEHAAAGKRRPGFDEDSVLAAEFDGRTLHLPGMILDLIDGGKDVCIGQECLEMSRAEVADPGCPQAVLVNESFKCFPRRAVDCSPFIGLKRRSGPVDEVEVEIVEPEFAKGFLEGAECRVIPTVGVPDFTADEEFIALNAALGESAAYGGLVAIVGRAVDVAVSVGNSPADDF